MLLILILNIFNGKKSSKFVIMVKNKIIDLIYNLGPHVKKIVFIIIWIMVGLNILSNPKNYI
jgi:hypothetical protein